MLVTKLVLLIAHLMQPHHHHHTWCDHTIITTPEDSVPVQFVQQFVYKVCEWWRHNKRTFSRLGNEALCCRIYSTPSQRRLSWEEGRRPLSLSLILQTQIADGGRNYSYLLLKMVTKIQSLLLRSNILYINRSYLYINLKATPFLNGFTKLKILLLSIMCRFIK